MRDEATEPDSIGIVQPETLHLELPPGGLVLDGGGVLSELQVCYETYGAAPAADGGNVIYICHALTGDSHAAGRSSGDPEAVGWWDPMIGPGKGIDTRYYHVVCSNILGGCKGTTGPSSTNPATGRPYGSDFPAISVGDIVTVQRLLLKQLGIERLAAVVGGSFGGMQVLEWAIRFAADVDRCICIASAANLSTQALAFDIIGRRAIVQDPDWAGGDYYETGRSPERGLSQARKLAHVTYVSQDLMATKFGRARRADWVNASPENTAKAQQSFKTTFQIESYLEHQGEKFVNRFDANSYLQITRAMGEYDLAERFGSLERAFAPVRAKMLIVALSGDWLFLPEQSTEMVNALIQARKAVSYCHLDAPLGHDAFLVHVTQLSGLIRAFLPWTGPQVAPPPPPSVDSELLEEYAELLKLLPEGGRVLDLGCGSGALLDMLAKRRGIKGVGVEIDVDRVIDVLDAGHDALLEDIDAGLAMIPDQAYDVAILSETLQVMRRPKFVLQEILRVAGEAVITFPNFGFWSTRAKLALTGRMPKDRHLPFEWYDTPNIHLFTLRDFVALCAESGIRVDAMRCVPGPGIGRWLVRMGWCNLGANRVVARITHAGAARNPAQPAMKCKTMKGRRHE